MNGPEMIAQIKILKRYYNSATGIAWDSWKSLKDLAKVHSGIIFTYLTSQETELVQQALKYGRDQQWWY